MALPSPAPRCRNTSWPRSVSSRTPAGVSATRYSSGLISVGTPTFTRAPPPLQSSDKLPPAQREPEVDPVTRVAEVAAGQLLDPADPVAQRVAVAEQLARGALPLAVLLDEHLERAQQLVAVVAVAAVLERAEDAVAVEPQRVVVLEREQELRRA